MKEKLVATKIKSIVLKCTTIEQFGKYIVNIPTQQQTKTCEFFVVPGNGQALLGMTDTETLVVLNINCNTIDIQTQNEQMYNKTEDGWQCTNKT